MSKIVQMFRLPGAQAAQYLGAEGQLVVDMAGPTIRVHDGVQPGGYRLLSGTGNLIELTNLPLARQNLGLGTAATQDADAFDAAGEAVIQINALALRKANNLDDLANAGTARTNLGVAIGSDVQAFNSKLASLAGSAGTADTFPYFSSANVFSLTSISSLSRTLLAQTTTAAWKTNLALGSAANVPVTTFCQVANNLSDVSSAAAARSNLGLTSNATATVFTSNGGGPSGGSDGDWYFIW